MRIFSISPSGLRETGELPQTLPDAGYVWMASNHIDSDPEASFIGSVAIIPWLGRAFRGRRSARRGSDGRQRRRRRWCHRGAGQGGGVRHAVVVNRGAMKTSSQATSAPTIHGSRNRSRATSSPRPRCTW